MAEIGAEIGAETGPPRSVATNPPAASGRMFWLLILALWLAEVTGSFETGMIYAAQRAVTDEFGDPVRVGWLITSYLIVGAGAAALAGRLGDLLGRRAVMLAILACGIAGSLLSAAGPTYALVLTGRCIQGATGAILPLCIGLARESLPRDKVPLGIGLMFSGASVGTVGGLVVGGLLVDHYHWRAVFLASAVFGAMAALLIRLFVPRSVPAPSGPRTDWVGGVLFVPAILALLVPISYGPVWGALDWRTLASAASGLVLLGVWIRVSLRNENPLFDVRLFANRQVAVGNIITALVALGALQITLIFSLMLQAPKWTGIGLGVSATVAGLTKMPSSLASMAAGPLGGWITARGGGRMTMVIGGVLCCAGFALSMVIHDTPVHLALVLFVASFGTTTLFCAGPTIIAMAVPHDRTSEAAGMTTVVRQAAMGIGAQMVSVLLATDTIRQPGSSAHYPTAWAFMLTIGVVIALCAAAALMALLLPRNAGVQQSFRKVSTA